ncbi:MAG: hypothetical protein KDI82_00170 [Gammaproteobacteria bacterium]|nr:hypothetical protein [Gammaproteobacteria bacterium]
MIRAYSQRLLPPYSGVVQIAETARARAQSFDGLNWDFHYFSGNEQGNGDTFRVQGYGLDRGFFNVAKLAGQQLHTFNFPACVNHDKVLASIQELREFLTTATIPFPLGDRFEYWLLDAKDGSPLALIHSCCEASVKASFPKRAEWTALPHSKMRVDNTESEKSRAEPPVNHRLQQLIARRAGSNPRAAWFERGNDCSDDFPGLLIREDWQDEGDHDLCQRYLMRKAPRLLMLQGLTTSERERMETAAKLHVLEVDEYCALYPEIVDEHRMAAIRVEARLRRGMPAAPAAVKEQAKTGPKRFDKDMRIIEN